MVSFCGAVTHGDRHSAKPAQTDGSEPGSLHTKPKPSSWCCRAGESMETSSAHTTIRELSTPTAPLLWRVYSNLRKRGFEEKLGREWCSCLNGTGKHVRVLSDFNSWETQGGTMGWSEAKTGILTTKQKYCIGCKKVPFLGGKKPNRLCLIWPRAATCKRDAARGVGKARDYFEAQRTCINRVRSDLPGPELAML